MADLISDGNTKVAWVSSIASITAPTAAELNAGNDWTTRLTPDGLKTDPTTASVDTSSLGSTFDTAQTGRRSYAVELTVKRGTTAPEDLPYATLLYGTTGFLVVRRGTSFTTNFTTGDKVEVYPVVCAEPGNVAPTANSVMKFTSMMMLTSDPATHAVVA